MAFKGWSAEAIEFFEALEADNSKTFWHAHKSIYEQEVRRPMEELLDELGKEFGEGKIFRPNRDIRFSADKSPYKTTIAGDAQQGRLRLVLRRGSRCRVRHVHADARSARAAARRRWPTTAPAARSRSSSPP